LPIAVLLSLIGVKGFVVNVPHRYFAFSKIGIDRDVLPISEVMVQSYEHSEHEIYVLFLTRCGSRAGLNEALVMMIMGTGAGEFL
jgi:hypothetical protein